MTLTEAACIFADTSYYVALFNEADASHARAVQFSREFRGTTLTTEYVIVELGNWLRKSVNRRIFHDFVQRLYRNPRVTIIDAERALLQAGIERYASRQDKDWSLTDCISFVVMERNGLT